MYGNTASFYPVPMLQASKILATMELFVYQKKQCHEVHTIYVLKPISYNDMRGLLISLTRYYFNTSEIFWNLVIQTCWINSFFIGSSCLFRSHRSYKVAIIIPIFPHCAEAIAIPTSWWRSKRWRFVADFSFLIKYKNCATVLVLLWFFFSPPLIFPFSLFLIAFLFGYNSLFELTMKIASRYK